MIRQTEYTAGCDLNKIKIPSSAAGFIKFRYGDVLNMDGKYTARHLHQIEKSNES